VVRWLIASCVLVHLLMAVLPNDLFYVVIERFTFISARYTMVNAWSLDPFAFIVAPFTYMYLHGGFTHLIMNMAMLLAFGTAIARLMDAPSFIVFYTICGIFGAIFWLLIHPDSTDPLLGASGAISGMLGAVGRISMGRPDSHQMPFRNRNTALLFVAIWLIFNFVFGIIGGALFDLGGEIAWEAHLGGFVAGFASAPFFCQPTRTDSPY